MKSEDYDYLAARLIEEREAIVNSTTPEARTVHQELAAHYARIIHSLEQKECSVADVEDLA